MERSKTQPQPQPEIVIKYSDDAGYYAYNRTTKKAIYDPNVGISGMLQHAEENAEKARKAAAS